MPQIQTKYFGPADCPPDSVFEFPHGLPGFENERRFAFVERPDTHPLLFMQSLSSAGVCFVLLPVLVAEPHYRLKVVADELATLGLPLDRQPEIGKEVLCAVVVSAGEKSGRSPTVNLLAPIVVNRRKRTGMQVIPTESAYSHQHPLMQEGESASCL